MGTGFQAIRITKTGCIDKLESTGMLISFDLQLPKKYSSGSMNSCVMNSSLLIILYFSDTFWDILRLIFGPLQLCSLKITVQIDGAGHCLVSFQRHLMGEDRAKVF